MTPEAFKAIRLQRDMTQKKLGALLFRDGREIRRWESGERPVPGTVVAFMTALGNGVPLSAFTPAAKPMSTDDMFNLIGADLQVPVYMLQGRKKPKHPKCKGIDSNSPSEEYDFQCDYESNLDCGECKYGAGRKDPEAACNAN